MTSSVKLVGAVLALALLSACGGRQVTRINPDEQIDLSGRWNDTDSKLVAEEMITDALSRPWRGDFQAMNGKKPVVIVGVIRNKTAEHIEAETFVKDLEREFVNSGVIRVVQNADFRERLRTERGDQGEFASPETQAQWGKELGADFMLFGVINAVEDSYRNERVINYKVNLELANIESNEKVWIGDKEIKKFIKR